MSYEIKHDESSCIGCGGCCAVCPQNWKMDGPKAKPINKNISEIGCNQKAADVCPVKCITVVEK
jgi:ferredoxin